MALLEPNITPILIALAAIAVPLGVISKILAVRLLMSLCQEAANDPVYQRSFRTRPLREERPRLRVVS